MDGFQDYTQQAIDILNLLPGFHIVNTYVRNSYQNDPFRVFLEGLLVFFAIKYLFSKKYKPNEADYTLTNEEVNQLIEEWKPEPLVQPLTEKQLESIKQVPEVVNNVGLNITLKNPSNGKIITLKNLVSLNAFNVLERNSIHEAAIEALKVYGVGTCGPPGFYGTLDAHIELEKKIADFIGTEAAILYSQGFSTISSVIPAFVKKGDIIVYDEFCSFGIQQGVSISKARSFSFKHNDLSDLERVLKDIQKKFKNLKNTRCFIVAEGIYANTGSLLNLPKLIELKKKFKYRCIVEESLSFGVLGERGAGLTDFYKVSPQEVDIFVASLCNFVGSSGGFAAGSIQIADHQRLSGQSYCFSASLPAVLAIAARLGIDYIRDHSATLVPKLHKNTTLLVSSLSIAKSFEIKHVDYTPFISIYVKNGSGLLDYNQMSDILQDCVNKGMVKGIFMSRHKSIQSSELRQFPPFIRLCVSACFSEQEIKTMSGILAEIFV